MVVIVLFDNNNNLLSQSMQTSFVIRDMYFSHIQYNCFTLAAVHKTITVAREKAFSHCVTIKAHAMALKKGFVRASRNIIVNNSALLYGKTAANNVFATIRQKVVYNV